MTRNTPPKKAMIPLIRSLRVKNRIVRLIPIVIVRPVRKRMSPSANIAESNRKIIPRNRKTHPYSRKEIIVMRVVIRELIRRIEKSYCITVSLCHACILHSVQSPILLIINSTVYSAAISIENLRKR